MSYRSEQAALHGLLSHYVATGNNEARDKMIAMIEARSAERSGSIGLLVKIGSVAAILALIIKVFF
jgi:hypothetical protein